MSEQNKQVMRRFYEEVVNAGNVDVIDELVAEDLVEYERFPGMAPDRNGVKQFFTLFKQAFPDSRMDPEDLIAEGDKVVARVTVTGTHRGEFLGIPATGKQVNVQGIDIVQFRDGKCIAHWGQTDVMAMMEQLGAMPAQEGAPAS